MVDDSTPFSFCRSDTLSSVKFCLSGREIDCSRAFYTRLQPLTYITLRRCSCVLIKIKFHAFCTFSAYFIVLLLVNRKLLESNTSFKAKILYDVRYSFNDRNQPRI